MKKFLFGILIFALGTAAVFHLYHRAMGNDALCCPFSQKAEARQEPQEVALAPQEEPKQEPEPIRKVDVNFDGAPLGDVLKFLGEGGLNYVYASSVDFRATVSVHVKDAPVLSVAKAVLQAAGAKYDVGDDEILIIYGN